MTPIPIALQLYTVRDDAEKDLQGIFLALSKIGYTNVELAGLYGLTAENLKLTLADYGLTPISAHVGLSELEGDNVSKTINDYLTVGVTTIIVPWLDKEIRTTGAGYVGVADRLNNVGELLGRYGITLGYHNHDFEFTELVDGTPAIETLIGKTDPSIVTFELDTYWALFAGHDPVSFISKHETRISLLHIKDLDPQDRSFAPIGTGLLPLAGIVDAAVAGSVRYLIVEQDLTKGLALDAVTTSINNLKSLRYA